MISMPRKSQTRTILETSTDDATKEQSAVIKSGIAKTATTIANIASKQTSTNMGKPKPIEQKKFDKNQNKFRQDKKPIYKKKTQFENTFQHGKKSRNEIKPHRENNYKNKSKTSEEKKLQHSKKPQRENKPQNEKNPEKKKKFHTERKSQNQKKTQTKKSTALESVEEPEESEFEIKRRKAREEKAAKRSQSKKKRLEKTKIISKKTKRGQPLMKDRIQYLLKQIQESK